MHIIALFFGLSSFATVAFSAAGITIDPNGQPRAAATTPGDKGWGMDPNGSPSRAAASDQGSMIDPDGKPAR